MAAQPDVDWCTRCGASMDPSTGGPCSVCWDGWPDDASFDWAVDAASRGVVVGEELLARIADPARTDALLALLRHDVPAVRRAAAVSLGRLAAPGTEPSIGHLLAGDDPAERSAARRALGEFGSAAAADLLVAHLQGTADVTARREAIYALGQLGDVRVALPARTLAEEQLESRIEQLRDIGNEGLDALARAGGDAHVLELLDRAAPRIRDLYRDRWAPDDPSRHGAEALRNLFFWSASWNGARPAPPAFTAHLDAITGEPPVYPSEPFTEAPVIRSVPRRAFADELASEPPAAGPRPHTKYGGQPDWREAPCWPVAPDGAQLLFLAQFDLGDQGRRTAYLFVDEAAESWDPLSEGNALVVQPGPPPTNLSSIDAATGPQLYNALPRSGFMAYWSGYRVGWSMVAAWERWPVADDSLDPATWDDVFEDDDPGDWNKVGGTPRWLQDEEFPPGDGWSYAFQVSAQHVGRELADGAHWYGFVDEAGHGAALWQCS